MTSSTTDRRLGLSGNTAFKAPVTLATTANITLSGEQTIDGTTTSASRVLVKDQTDTTTNGLYDTTTGAWTRCIDANGNYDLAKGTLVLVTGGSTNIGMVYQLTSATPTIGTSLITWALSLTASAAMLSFLQSGAGAVIRSLLTKVREILNVADFGAVGDDSTDDQAAFTAAIVAANALGGGTVRAMAGKTHKLTIAPTVLDRVTLDLNGGTLHLTLSGAASEGVKLRNYATVQNGTINVTSTGSPGTQGGIHAPITIGPLSGSGGTVASPSSDEGVQGWTVRNVSLSTDRAGKSGIQVMGGATNGLIEGVTIPDSTTIGIGIGLDWNYVGTLVSSTDAGIVAGKIAFNASTMYTTHPHNITIRNCKMGLLTNATSHGVRLSGCHGITVENVEVAQSNFAGFYHTAGDAGYEFAPVAIKAYRHRGIRVKNFLVMNANNGFGLFADAYADNVASAVTNLAYVPLLAAINEADIVFEQCRTKGTASVQVGIRFQQIIGGRAIDCEATGHVQGAIAEIAAEDVQFIRGRYYANTENGIKFDNATTKPVNCRAIDTDCYGNGATFAGIYLANSTRCVAKGNKLGRATETQTNGIKAAGSGSCTLADIQDNYSIAVAGGGVHYVLGATTDYGIVDIFADNDHGSGTSYSGLNIIPFAKAMHPTATNRPRIFISARTTLTADITPPAAMASVVGDTIQIIDPTAGTGYAWSYCTVAGSPGTWKGKGLAQA